MALDFLTLCNELIRDVGIGQEVSNTASPPAGELRNVVRWIKESCEDIDKQWIDWRYLWRQYDATLTTGSNAAPQASLDEPVRQWDRADGRMRVLQGADWMPLQFIDYADFMAHFYWETSTGLPAYWSVKPDDTVVVAPLPDDDYAIRGFYWRRSSVLTNNADQPLMPDEHRRIIVSRAKIRYGDREDAPEIIAGAEAEFLDRLKALEGDQLEGQRQGRMAQADQLLFMETE